MNQEAQKVAIPAFLRKRLQAFRVRQGKDQSYIVLDQIEGQTYKFEPWQFKDDVSLGARPTDAKQIDIDYSSYNYQVVWKYDRDNNSYLRYQAEDPHLMANEKQIEALRKNFLG